MTAHGLPFNPDYAAFYHTKGLSIGGKWRPGSGGEFDVFNPATGKVWAHAPDGTRADATAAIEAASEAQKSWAALPFHVRADHLLKVADVLEKRRPDFVAALTSECGGWIRKGMFETGYTPKVYRSAAAAAYLPTGETLASDHNKTSVVERTPLGVISVISPWNVPLLLSSRGLGVALAVGNTVVLKPSEETPITGGLMIAEVFEEAGMPPGVLNVVTCSRDNVAAVGDELVTNPLIKAISFTGSTAVGRSIAATAGGLLKKACVELGGKDSLLVLDDADIDRAVHAARFGAFFHQGQICMSAEKIIVDASLEDVFMTKFMAATQELGLGDPSQVENHLGPMINETQAAKVDARLAKARADGVTFHAGGGRDGLFYQPTIITGATPQMEIFHEEVFGPVANIIFAGDEDEAVALANDCQYGLSASIMTRDVERGLRIARRIESGMAHVNDTTIYDEPTVPFGGVKNSGLGRHGGRWSAETFTETRWFTVERGGRKTPF
ncbi:MAG: aldehyde dehydrogenase family protein [Pseudomonadota bacterium]